MSIDIKGIDDFEYERSFFVREIPEELVEDSESSLIISSYFVHDDNYALRVRLQSSSLHIDLTSATDPKQVLDEYRNSFTSGEMAVKGPSYGGTRYEASRAIDTRIAGELIARGGDLVIKNRYSVWTGEDGWVFDVYGGANAPLIIAKAARSMPVTNLVIPKFCVTEITDQSRFSNDELSWKPYNTWQEDFERELATEGPRFEQIFGHNMLS